jgi:hypothetical protein
MQLRKKLNKMLEQVQSYKIIFIYLFLRQFGTYTLSFLFHFVVKVIMYGLRLRGLIVNPDTTSLILYIGNFSSGGENLNLLKVGVE